jgi:hypothetical protein
MDLKIIVWGGMDGIRSCKDRFQWRALVNTVLNLLQVTYTAENSWLAKRLLLLLLLLFALCGCFLSFTCAHFVIGPRAELTCK